MKGVLFLAILFCAACEPCKSDQEQAKRVEEKCVEYCLRYVSPEFAKLKIIEELAFAQQKIDQWAEIKKQVEKFKMDIKRDAALSCQIECGA